MKRRLARMTRLGLQLTALALAPLAIAATGSSAFAEIPNNTVRIGVLTDMTGPFADQVGAGSVAAARMAAEDFAAESNGLQVEILVRRPPEQA